MSVSEALTCGLVLSIDQALKALSMELSLVFSNHQTVSQMLVF